MQPRRGPTPITVLSLVIWLCSAQLVRADEASPDLSLIHI